MADAQKPGSTTITADNMLDSVEAVGANLVRVGVALVSVPFYVLPEKARQSAIDATTDLFTTIGELHLGLLKAALRGVGTVTSNLSKEGEAATAAPKASTKVSVDVAPSAKR